MLQFSLFEVIQFLGVALCLLMLVYLVSTMKRRESTIVLLCYFLVLITGFLQFLVPVFITKEISWLRFAFVLIERSLPSISLLFIVQCMTAKRPALPYWAVLLVPLIASGPFVYLYVFVEEICLQGQHCFASEYAFFMNDIFVSAIILIFTVFIWARLWKLHAKHPDRGYRHSYYWLITALILMNVLLLFMELGVLSESFSKDQYHLAASVIKITFIYMVFTSFFRVFGAHRKRLLANEGLTEEEKHLAEKALYLAQEQKLYREAGFGRKEFAAAVSMKEHQLSRIVNNHFGRSITELLNELRIKEAKEWLTHKKDSITVIAFDVGFSSLTSFNRVFKEQTGCSPSEYRRMK